MRQNQHIALLTAMLSIAALAFAANAQVDVSSVYTIPVNFSASHPMLLLAETSELQDPASVGWKVVSFPNLGSFNRISASKWFCYFSNFNQSNCGPIPFAESGSGVKYDLDITAFSANGKSAVKAFSVSPGELKLNVVAKELDENRFLEIIAAEKATVQGDPKYTILKAEDLSYFDSGNLELVPSSGHHRLNRTLPSGKYYISYEFTTVDKGSGGFVEYVQIGGEEAEGSLDADPATDEAKAEIGESYSKEYSIRNQLNQEFNLTYEVASDIKDIVKITLSKMSIASKETIKYTVKAENLRSNYFINSFFELYTGTGTARKLLNKIPIRLKIELTGQAQGG